MNWYKMAKSKKNILTKEMKDYFEKRTKDHIQRVQNASKKIVNNLPEFEELIYQTKDHDKSKFNEPEYSAYVSLTWRKKPGNENIEQNNLFPKEKENKATLSHVKSNSHHPEYHLKDKNEANIDQNNRDKSQKCVDASFMPDLDIAEMVADWQAMSEELKTNTAREWFDKQKDVRWHFSKKQEKLIDKLLKVFE